MGQVLGFMVSRGKVH